MPRLAAGTEVLLEARLQAEHLTLVLAHPGHADAGGATVYFSKDSDGSSTTPKGYSQELKKRIRRSPGEGGRLILCAWKERRVRGNHGASSQVRLGVPQSSAQVSVRPDRK